MFVLNRLHFFGTNILSASRHVSCTSFARLDVKDQRLCNLLQNSGGLKSALQRISARVNRIAAQARNGITNLQVHLKSNYVNQIAPRARKAIVVGYSPALFAREAPSMFAHDPSTNRLSLVGDWPPWIKDDNKDWNYCVDCWERFFSTRDKFVQHVPFRDRASQSNMKISWRERKRRAEELAQDEIDDPQGLQNSQAAEPPLEDEDDVGLGMAEGDEDKVVDDEIFQSDLLDGDGDPPPAVEEGKFAERRALSEADEDEEETLGECEGDIVLPTEQRPTLQDYQAKWAALLEEHSRAVAGVFSLTNLCPKPIHQLWQDCLGLMIFI